LRITIDWAFARNKHKILPDRLRRRDLPMRRALSVPKYRTELELKTYLANNLDCIEPGLRLFTRGNWTGVEVPCAFSEWSRPGLIDILAVDPFRTLVVIEIKPDGKATAFGQLLCYMAWIRQWATTDDPGGRSSRARDVRGVIVARRATPMLLFLVKAYPQFPITVYETEATVALTDE
jgi:RecB family endonuclease NucS